MGEELVFPIAIHHASTNHKTLNSAVVVIDIKAHILQFHQIRFSGVAAGKILQSRLWVMVSSSAVPGKARRHKN